MTLGDRLKKLRQDLGLSQEALGAQGFVSAPGWIKIENGQRQASEKLIERLCQWLVTAGHMKKGAALHLRGELLTLKHLGSRSGFVREMAKRHAKDAGLAHLLAPSTTAKPRRGRPVDTRKAGGR